MNYRTQTNPSTAGLALIWLLSIAGVVLIFATTGVLHYLGLSLTLASSIVSIRHGLRLRAFLHAGARPTSNANGGVTDGPSAHLSTAAGSPSQRDGRSRAAR
jgi:hypothetical protein